MADSPQGLALKIMTVGVRAATTSAKAVLTLHKQGLLPDDTRFELAKQMRELAELLEELGGDSPATQFWSAAILLEKRTPQTRGRQE